MGDLTNSTPKPMLKIGGRPILEYTLSGLPKEISEVILIVGYHGQKIKNHFGEKFSGKKLRYVWQQRLDGTGGAIWQIKNLLKSRFMVLMGDDIYHQNDLRKLLAYELALLVKEVEDNKRFGVVEIDEVGYLKGVVEFRFLKEGQASNLVNIGAYMLTKEFFNYPLVPVSETEFGLPQTMAQMADKHKIKVVEADFWHPTGLEEDLIKGEEIVNRYFNNVKK